MPLLTRRQRLELVEPRLGQTPSISVFFATETLGQPLAHSRPEIFHLCHGWEDSVSVDGRGEGPKSRHPPP